MSGYHAGGQKKLQNISPQSKKTKKTQRQKFNLVIRVWNFFTSNRNAFVFHHFLTPFFSRSYEKFNIFQERKNMKWNPDTDRQRNMSSSSCHHLFFIKINHK